VPALVFNTLETAEAFDFSAGSRTEQVLGNVLLLMASLAQAVDAR
jgi:hypothetical protein